MDGFININKGQGLTSFAVLKKLQKIIPRTKMGHLGTLDPMAEGVLPVALGHATRLIEYIPDAEKVYQASMTLGAVSDTQDAWGTIVETGHTSFQEEDLRNILHDFTGTIQQIPPMYSAVHHQGTRLYELARQGIEVERQPRTVDIISLQLLGMGKEADGKPLIDLEVACSKGTYIRTLCHDIGQRLGTGAYMSKLVRTRAGIFSIQEALTLEEIEERKASLSELIKPLDYPISQMTSVILFKQDEITRIRNGNQVSLETELSPGLVKVYIKSGDGEEQGSEATQNNCLLAIANLVYSNQDKYIQPLKVFK